MTRPQHAGDWRTRAADAEARGLYRASTEHDACGVGFVARVDGERTHEILVQAIAVLEALHHRGAAGSDPLTGDGAGVLLQVPHELLARDLPALPPRGEYGVGMFFLAADETVRAAQVTLIEAAVRAEGAAPIAWREVPTDPGVLGPTARASVPAIRQLVVSTDSERALYLVRKAIERVLRASGGYVCSFSSKTVVYKGLVQPASLARFYLDLADDQTRTALAVVHQRFSTNTFPAWERAHPYRLLAHNGEINTLRGNVNWMRGREETMEDGARLRPVIDETGSDSAMLDQVLELLVRSGRSLPHAVMMTIPEAWERHTEMSPARRAFYEYHASLIEPWDGPAAIAFSDGDVVGAVLDRNGLRPARWVATHDGLVVMASEAGVLPIAPDRIRTRGRLQPGRMLLVDTREGRLVDDDEIKERIAHRAPYAQWLAENLVRLGDEPAAGSSPPPSPAIPGTAARFGWTEEDLKLIVAPMARTGEEPVGSMGNDTPLAVLSDRPQPLFHYFKQLFAQVTNPPIDPIREELVMSLRTTLGPEHDFLTETPRHCHQLELRSPILTREKLAAIRRVDRGELRSATVTAHFEIGGGGDALRRGLADLQARAAEAVRGGATILIVSDRGTTPEYAAIPALLAVAAVHHGLIRAGLRHRCGIVSESGEPREVMHFALLIGFGAGAVVPWLAYDVIDHLTADGRLAGDPADAHARYVRAVEKGLLKILSKMGISTLQSYRGAQIFEAIGLGRALVDEYFPGTPSRIEGIGLEVIAEECRRRHERDALDPGGQYKWRRDGERHAYDPQVVATLQHATRSGRFDLFRKYSAVANEESRATATIRGLLGFRAGARPPVPIDEVEPAREIVRRFKTGAMSFGSLSQEAHENLAAAMNRLGGKSNSGEGGEDPERDGTERRSAIRQVASGRFGVTLEYLVHADELQIKMAQGAKPGEGGQLPGHKVVGDIARVRLATEGVSLISPPPHHDIYSIEDLAQLVSDLKHANERARVTVKLVAEVGVGTVAAGVAKAKADGILISGDSGGTGASPLGSIKHAGIPWELGLAEAQQVLVLNGLRGRVRLEVDGQLKTGRDVAVAALLGAEEFGFGTAALVASGCIMMRACHLNTCPVGVATQDPALRARFKGEPEHVINFMVFVAEELREIMAELGFRSVDEMVGRADLLEARIAADHWKAAGIDLAAVLHRPDAAGAAEHQIEAQDHGLERAFDRALLDAALPAIEHGRRVEIAREVRNVDRTVGTMLSAEVVRRRGRAGLPDGALRLLLRGSAGQSFGAFLAPGVEAHLEGEANDSFAKGLSGGRVIVVPPRDATFAAEEQIIVGNVALYGATGGEAFIRGRAGERFAVRNSGAVAVVEGVGDHGCEYMTRGTVVVLGSTGRNFAAGMTGGEAFVYDADGAIVQRCNRALVELRVADDAELERIRTLVERHRDLTASALAWRILSGWKRAASRFVAVVPRREIEKASTRWTSSARS